MSAFGGDLNREFPFPLVKSGVLSGLGERQPITEIWVDDHNNPGFSGGPLVFMPNNERFQSNGVYRVAGVISAYQISQLPVYNALGHQIGMIPENSGILLAYNIKFAVDMIDANPIGCKLDAA